MGIAVVATFVSLIEAQIAASALESGGLHPLVMDQGYGSVVWIQQATLQGFRLAVPTEEVADAIAFFRALPRVREIRAQARSPVAVARSNWWRVAAAILGFGLAPVFGWLAVGLRPRRFRRRDPAPFAFILAAAVALLIGALLVLFLVLISCVPLAVWIVSPLVAAVAVVAFSTPRQPPPEL